MKSTLWYVSPIAKERTNRIKLIKEMTNMSLKNNRCINTTNYENNEKNNVIEFKNVKPSIVGSEFRPHSYEWSYESNINKENIMKLRYINILKDRDKRKLNIEEKIKQYVKLEIEKEVSNIESNNINSNKVLV